jgi:hypothetical protein
MSSVSFLRRASGSGSRLVFHYPALTIQHSYFRGVTAYPMMTTLLRTPACRRALSAATLFLLLPFAVLRGWADDAPANPDVIVFTNGDQLSGKLTSSTGGKVNFHSDIAGDVTVDWAKVKEIRTSQKFAIVANGVKVTRHTPASQVPEGTISYDGKNVDVQTAAGTKAEVPAANINVMIDQPTYDKTVYHEPGFFHGWNGSGTFGATIVAATQDTYTYTGGVSLARVVPNASWLAPRNRTTTDFSGSYGKITDPSYIDPVLGFVPETTVKTSIYHYDFERDEYVTDRLYYLGALSYDHNFSQSLQLQQIYGGGIGYTIIKQPKQTLDLKALMQYERQNFIDALPGENQNLIGSTFSANYLLHLPKGMLFNQQVAYIPAWNNLHAYSVTELNTFSIPAYKRLSLTLGTLDSYLNNPATALPPVKRNSFQFTAGVTYTFK